MICPSCEFDNHPGSEECGNCGQDLASLDRPVAHDRVERSLMEDCVATLAPRTAVTLPPEATVGEAVRLMLERDIGALLVVNDAGGLVGIFSERDLLTKVAGRGNDYAGRPLREFMTADPEGVRPTDSLAFALHKMQNGGYRHLPVLRDGRPVGMVSVRDMLRHITKFCKDR